MLTCVKKVGETRGFREYILYGSYRYRVSLNGTVYHRPTIDPQTGDAIVVRSIRRHVVRVSDNVRISRSVFSRILREAYRENA